MTTAEQLARMSPAERQDLYRRRSIRLKGVHVLPTMRVVREDGHEVTINKSDFDPAIHKEVDESAPTNEAPAPEKGEEIQDLLATGYSREELEAMSIADLKLLPEWEGVEGRSRLKTKEQIVDALLEVF